MFSFSNKEKEKIEQIGDLITQKTDKTDKTDEIVTSTITKVIKFNDTQLTNYYRIDLMDFIEPTYGNLRPTSLKINLTNYDDKISTITFSYIHTPLINELIDHINQSTLSVNNQFNKSFSYTVQSPYLTYYQLDSQMNLTDIDISQLTNINLIKERSQTVSLGGIYLSLNRFSSGSCSVELSMTLSYKLRLY